MLNIQYDNIIFALQRAGGGSSYWYEIISRALMDSETNLQFIEPMKKYAKGNIFYNQLSENRNCIEESITPKISRYLPVNVAALENTIFHSSLYRFSRAPKIQQVVTVHDFIYEKLRRGPARVVNTLQKKMAVKHAQVVICVSNYTKRDFLEHYPNFSERRVVVIYNGISENFASSGSSFENKPSRSNKVVYVGDRSPYKRFDVAVKAVTLCPDLVLTIVGGGPLTLSEQDLLNRALPKRFEHLSWIDSKDLRTLYQSAFSLIYPSEYEGFGIPVIEAMGSGCPVVARNATSVGEIANGYALLSNSSEPEEYAFLLESLRSDSAAEVLIRRGLDHSDKFSWQKCYSETKALYKRVVLGEFE